MRLNPPRLLHKIHWWGGPVHKLFTIVVFVILASLDNTARGVLPPLYAVIGRDLAVADASLGLVTSLSTLVVAVSAVIWGYWGDRHERKPLLLIGTLIWAGAMFVTGWAQSYSQILLFQLITAVGIGCISSVGFSVISDFIPPARRGLALSFWGISQGGGAGAGAMLSGSLGAYNWPLPFFLVASAGGLFAIFYLFTFEPKRGQAEPELTTLFEAGDSYEHHIQWSDIRHIFSIKTNRWLFLQGFISLIGTGSLVWTSRLFIAKVALAGHSLETATVAGNLLSLFFQTGFYFAILGGHLGDRWQQRDPRGRAWLGMIGMWASIPFQIAVFFIPLQNLNFPEEAGLIPLLIASVVSIFVNPWIATTFIVALFAFGFLSLASPNLTALFTDVNLPEHRGTIAGLLAVSLGSGLALGNWLSGLTFAYLEPYLAQPLNFAVGLTLFQLFLIPAGFCYYQVSKTAGADIAAVKQMLTERATISQHK